MQNVKEFTQTDRFTRPKNKHLYDFIESHRWNHNYKLINFNLPLFDVLKVIFKAGFHN